MTNIQDIHGNLSTYELAIFTWLITAAISIISVIIYVIKGLKESANEQNKQDE